MWIFILIIIIIGIILFKIYDRDFITATPSDDDNYHLVFETGKEADCELVDVFKCNEKEYYVFIPIESIKSVADEDIIILLKVRKKENKIIFIFADEATDEIIYQTVKRDYSEKYTFV